MPEEARAVQHLTSSQLLNVLRRRDLLRVDENLGRDECLAKLHAAGVKEVPADEVAPTARPTPAAKAASSGSSAAETRSETGVARARSEERASPDPSPVAARPFAASRPALLQGFLRKRPVRSLWGSTRRRWISLGEETIGWSEDEQSAQLGALPLGGAVVELSESKRELSVSVGAQSLVLLAADGDGVPLDQWADAIQRQVLWLYMQPVEGEVRLSATSRDGPPDALASGRSLAEALGRDRGRSL